MSCLDHGVPVVIGGILLYLVPLSYFLDLRLPLYVGDY